MYINVFTHLYNNGCCICSICLKTTPTNSVEICRKYKVTVLIRCRFDFNLTDIGFALTKMSLKWFIYT